VELMRGRQSLVPAPPVHRSVASTIGGGRDDI
jgi:hypothetical protein